MKKTITFLVGLFLLSVTNVWGQTKGSNFLENITTTGYYLMIKENNFFQVDVTPRSPRLAGTYDEVVFYNTANSVYNSIQVKNVYQYSDARAKKNISPLDNALYKVLNLSPVTYNWKNSQAQSRVTEVGDTLKEIGLLAQEVEAIIPEAVKTDEEGKRLINYTALIPYLIDAVKDLQGQIEVLQAEKEGNSRSLAMVAEKEAMLGQNTPNPAVSTTSVSVEIPSYAVSSYIQIYTLQGNPVKKVSISDKGKSKIQINVSDMTPGIYMYSLMVDNKLIQTKRMVVTD